MEIKVVPIEVHREKVPFVLGGVYKPKADDYYILVANDNEDDTDVTKYTLITNAGVPYFSWKTYREMAKLLDDMYTFFPDAHLVVTREVIVDAK